MPIEMIAHGETLAVPEEFVQRPGGHYVLKVRGNSMIDAHVTDGDFVVVNERRSCDNGEMVIAMVQGSSATVKKFFREKDGRIRLQPANETMDPIYVHENDISIQGVVVGVLRRF
jgi:repressor LexA